MPRSSVCVQKGESDNSFWGPQDLVEEIRRKQDAVHFVLKHGESEVVVRFNIQPDLMRQDVMYISCWSADEQIAENNKVRVILNCLDDFDPSCIDECVAMDIAHWPYEAPKPRPLKTMIAQYNAYMSVPQDQKDEEFEEYPVLDLDVKVMEIPFNPEIAANRVYEIWGWDKPFEERCAGVVERRFDKDEAFSPLTRPMRDDPCAMT